MKKEVKINKNPKDLELSLRKGSNREGYIIATIPAKNRAFLQLENGDRLVCRIIQIDKKKKKELK